MSTVYISLPIMRQFCFILNFTLILGLLSVKFHYSKNIYTCRDIFSSLLLYMLYIFTFKTPVLSMCVCAQSCPSHSVTPWTAAHQAPLFMRFPRQEYRSGLPFPSPGDFPDPGIKPMSLALAAVFFTTEPTGKPCAIQHKIIAKCLNTKCYNYNLFKLSY